MTGFGTVNSTNTLAKARDHQWHCAGEFRGFPITLSGYIKGLGTFNNVTFTGHVLPRLSPITVTAGTSTFSSTSTLIMELGGIATGSGHDQIQSSGSLALDGTLAGSLINGFAPSGGQSFNLFDWTIVSGTFAYISLPTLAGGLAWNTSQLYTTGVLIVASAGHSWRLQQQRQRRCRRLRSVAQVQQYSHHAA